MTENTHISDAVSRHDVEGITTRASSFPSYVRAGDYVFITGQVSIDDDGQVVAPGDVHAQTAQALSRLRRITEAAGGGIDSIVTATCYLTKAEFALEFNAAWAATFGEHRPARATVVAELLDPLLLVEVQATAYIPVTGISQLPS
ncbi:hypothetical protein GCM10022381_34800 [Leifsonia kafniensis]|uniref:RidA family protein n=1 Tax=Leifsonia kafniensis TaxID=475957 RepID=A0ABP7KWI9_9MICO